MKIGLNTRVLIIDDDETIRSSFHDILAPKKLDSSSLEAASASLFGDDEIAVKKPSLFDFRLDLASNGKDGYERVKRAIDLGDPYAAIFVDMRMPGWDGLTTVQHIREIDRRAEIVFVTAYSDYGIDEIISKAGINVSYHCKPFSVEEIRQIATKAVYEWSKARNLENLIETIATIRGKRWQMNALLENVLLQVSEMLGSPSAMIAKKDNEGRYSKLTGIGALADPNLSDAYLQKIPGLIDRKIFQAEGFAFFPLERFGILALFEKDGRSLNNERIYLVRVFLEQAGQAIDNVDLYEIILQKEKLSAVGEAVNMVVHDLRGPIGNIKNCVQLIMESAGRRESVEELLQLVLESANESLDMLTDIIDYSKDKKVSASLISVKELFHCIERKMAHYLMELKVALITNIESDFTINVDTSKLQRVLINLLRNAAQAVGLRPGLKPEVILSASREGDHAVFKVRDFGPGIPEDVKPDLFKPFASSGKKYGTGLGLAIVKHFVDAHKGEIGYSSSDEGTEFTVRIPISKDV